MSERSPATVALHAGQTLKTRAQGVTPALHLASVSHFEHSADLDDALDGRDFVYGRINAPNAHLLEQAVAALEGAEAAAAFGSGMAALRSVFEVQALLPGAVVVTPADGYGATFALFKRLCGERQLRFCPLLFSAPDAAQALRALRPSFVLAESLTNPLLTVPDLPALAAVCEEVGATFAVDATFASPVLQRPLSLGAHYAIHSTTKWINGHGDALGGVVSASAGRIAALKAFRTQDGAILGPFDAYLTLRGLRTLPLRMSQHVKHARALAERLTVHPLVARVHHPFLPSHQSHAIAKRLLPHGEGGVLSFEVKGAGRAEIFSLLEQLTLARPAPSLGDVTTLVMHPATASARRMSEEERARAGILENLLRVSVGLEDPEDLFADLSAALKAALA